MLIKIIGYIFLVVGALMAFGILFQLIGDLMGLVWTLVKLAVPAVFLYVGYRLALQDSD